MSVGMLVGKYRIALILSYTHDFKQKTLYASIY